MKKKLNNSNYLQFFASSIYFDYYIYFFIDNKQLPIFGVHLNKLYMVQITTTTIN